MKKIKFAIAFMLLVGIMFFYCISLINAEQVDKPIIISVTCSNSTYANISSIIYKTNSTYILKGETSMTKAGTEYNYTLSSNLNNKIGTLEIKYHCDLNGIDSNFGYLIDITTTGEQVSLSNIIIVIAFLFISGMLFLLGYTIEKDKFIIKSGIYLFSLLMLLVSLNSGRIIASESIGLSSMSEVALILVIAFILFFFLYIFISWMIRTFKLFKEKKNMRWQY